MAKTASLKKTTRAGSRSVPNPLPDPAGSSGEEVVAIERNQRITKATPAPHVAGATSWRTWRVRPSSSSQSRLTCAERQTRRDTRRRGRGRPSRGDGHAHHPTPRPSRRGRRGGRWRPGPAGFEVAVALAIGGIVTAHTHGPRRSWTRARPDAVRRRVRIGPTPVSRAPDPLRWDKTCPVAVDLVRPHPADQGGPDRCNEIVSLNLVRCECSPGGVSFNLVQENPDSPGVWLSRWMCSGDCDLFFSLGPGIVGGNVESPLNLACASLLRDALEFGIKHYAAIDAGHPEAEVDQDGVIQPGPEIAIKCLPAADCERARAGNDHPVLSASHSMQDRRWSGNDRLNSGSTKGPMP